MTTLSFPFRAAVRTTVLVVCAILISRTFGRAQTAWTGVILKGQVVDTAGLPVPRATVTVRSPQKGRFGTATDLYGRFRFHLPDSVTSQVDVRATSVGFLPTDTTFSLVADTLTVTIVCRPEVVETGRVEVTGYRNRPNQVVRLNHRTLSTAAMKTLIPSDPLAAIRYPQLAHFGLNFASQLRIDGSIPRYYLNGVSIGADPTHFGAFAFIPTPAVEQIDFSPQGTNAVYSTPSVIDLKTVGHTVAGHRGEFTASIIDLTGSYLIASNRAFVGATVRQSLIDQLADAINLGSSRHEIPAPKITDLLVCSGYRLSKTLELTTDFYRVHDDLLYDLDQKTGATGTVSTRQKSTESHISARLSYRSGRWHGSLTGGLRSGTRSFKAVTERSEPNDFLVDFEEQYKFLQANTDFGFNGRWFDLTIGDQYESMPSQKLYLRQLWWNLLSPFAHSDNLNFFQNWLNMFYEEYDGRIDGYTNGLYASGLVRIGPLEIDNGLRLEHFSYLARHDFLGHRHSIDVPLGDKSSLRLFYGTFFESPLTTAAEAYQVAARRNIANLSPVETRLGTISLTYGRLTFELFDKDIRRAPVLTPDYAHATDTFAGGQIIQLDPRFLEARSGGHSTFYGASVAINAPNWPTSRFDCYASYAYSKARTTVYGITMPFDLDSPHRLVLQCSFIVSSRIRCSADWTIHTGYPYSPNRNSSSPFYVPDESLYVSDLKMQNSARFSPNASLNLHLSYRVGNGDLFLSIVNSTNRANQMIGTKEDFIYDSGLIPNIGFQYRF